MYKYILAPLIKLNFLFTNPNSIQIHNYLESQNFKGTVLVAKEGKVLFCHGYGFANAEYKIPNNEKTVFRLGSITKQFTAIAIMQLQENGRLDIHDPIEKYLPDYPSTDISIHHLLTHTSGIPSITKLSNLAQIQRQPSQPLQVIEHFKNLPLEFSCGADCKYSDSGYIILGAIIEAITKMPYEKYLETHFFQPLGMQCTYFDHNQTLIPNRASGYAQNDHGDVVNAEFIEMSFPHAAGSLASTVVDLYIWDCALKANKFLSHESYEKVFSIQASSEKHHISYGYGFFIDPKKHSIGHMGSIEGFRAALYRYLDNDLTIIVLSNHENTKARLIQEELAFLLTHNSYWRL